MEQNKITRPLEVIETEINFYKQQTKIGIIEIGKRLVEAKELVEHGEWTLWLEDKIDFTPQSARKFMRCYEEFGKGNSGFDLGTKKMWLLLDVPSEDRDDFISTPHITQQGEEKTIEEMTTREVEKAVKEWKLKEHTKDIWSIVDKEYDDNTYDIPIADLKPFPNHEKYFWNMSGKNYIDFLTSIERNGVINPIIITRNNMIISGHQRVRACKDLGIDVIPTRYLQNDNPKNRNLNDLLLCDFICLNMHTRTSVFYLACAWYDLYFGNGDKVDYYHKKFIEHDDTKLDEWLANIQKEINMKQCQIN